MTQINLRNSQWFILLDLVCGKQYAGLQRNCRKAIAHQYLRHSRYHCALHYFPAVQIKKFPLEKNAYYDL